MASVTTYRVKAGDSITSIAQNKIGDPNSWQDIVQLNNLVAPYTITEGQIIIIPVPLTQAAILAASAANPGTAIDQATIAKYTATSVGPSDSTMPIPDAAIAVSTPANAATGSGSSPFSNTTLLIGGALVLAAIGVVILKRKKSVSGLSGAAKRKRKK